MMYEGDNVVLYFSDAGLRPFADSFGFLSKKNGCCANCEHETGDMRKDVPLPDTHLRSHSSAG